MHKHTIPLQDTPSLLLLLCCALIAVACDQSSYANPSDDLEPPNSSNPAEDPTPTHTQSLVDFAQCDASETWSLSNPEMPSFSVPSALSFAPHSGALLAHTGAWGEGQILRTSNGEKAFALAQPIGQGTVSQDWSLQTTADQNTIALVTMMTGNPVWETVLGDTAMFLGARISQDGSRVVIAQCTDQVATFTAWSTFQTSAPVEVSLAGECWSFQPYGRDTFHLSPDGNTALVSFGHNEDFAFASIDLRDGQVHAQNVTGLDRETVTETWMSHAVLGAAFHPDSSEVAITHADGILRFWTLPDLQPTRTPVESGVLTLNLMSYVPTSWSPVAWSPDGTSLALMLSNGDISVRSLETNREHLLLPHPSTTQDELRQNVPARLQFSPDGASLAVLYERGLSLWTCPNAPTTTPRTDIRVRIDGPTSISLGEEGRWTATHLDDLSIHSHTFFVDGEQVAEPSTARGLTWTPDELGMHTLKVVVDDGFHSGVQEMIFEVR